MPHMSQLWPCHELMQGTPPGHSLLRQVRRKGPPSEELHGYTSMLHLHITERRGSKGSLRQLHGLPSLQSSRPSTPQG